MATQKEEKTLLEKIHRISKDEGKEDDDYPLIHGLFEVMTKRQGGAKLFIGPRLCKEITKREFQEPVRFTIAMLGAFDSLLPILNKALEFKKDYVSFKYADKDYYFDIVENKVMTLCYLDER